MISVCFTFDDGRGDNFYFARNILNKYDFKATFFVIGSCFAETKTVSLDCSYCGSYLNAEMIRGLIGDGHEIGSHSQSHSSDFDDILLGHQTLLRSLCREEGVLSIPNSKLVGSSYRNLKKSLSNSCFGIRVGRKSANKFLIAPFYYAYQKKPSEKLFYLINKCNLIKKRNTIIHSIPVTNNVRPNDLIYLIKRAIEKNRDIVFMFHSIGNNEDKWTWRESSFDLCLSEIHKLVLQKKVKICTFGQLFK